jgi:DNA helicase-2/ATP-dependent DNA helicase PcrA
MTEKEFIETYDIKLNKQQREAMKEVENPVMVLAVPGSGKTTTLIARLGYMTKVKEIDPSNILVVTYTVAATKDMTSRYLDKFHEDECKIEFRTINGICSKIISYASSLYQREVFTLLSEEKDRNRAINVTFQKVTKRYPTESETLEIGTKITYAKNMMLTDREIESFDTGEIPFSDIYREYNETLRENEMMDYDDQMVFAYKFLLNDDRILSHYQEMYKYICVDESQDTSKIQHKIIEILASKYRNIFMVGDEDQSIYGFRAAYPKALLNFEHTYKDAKVLYMEENFRSGKAIVKSADEFIQKNTLRHKKSMNTNASNTGIIKCEEILKRSSQYNLIYKKLEEYSKSNKDIAVLYRDNEFVIPIIDRMLKNNIPFNMKQKDCSFFTNPVVMDVKNMLLFAQNPKDVKAFSKIYFKLSLYLTKGEMMHATKMAAEKGISVFKAISESTYIKESKRKRCGDIAYYFKQLNLCKGEDIFFYIKHGLKYYDYCQEHNLDVKKFDILEDIAKSLKDTKEFLERLDCLYNAMKYKQPENSRITLSTIHSSKGLEYDSVILLDVINGLFPSMTKTQMEKQENRKVALETYEEERRLYYVAITRAKKELFLYNIKGSSEFISDTIKVRGI